MGKLFGTDGVRGKVNEKLTPELAYQLGRAGAYYFLKNSENPYRKIIIGRDTRISGPMLEAALIAGVTSIGVDAIILGVVPTPTVAFLAQYLEVDGGIMISASHNPYYDNGIKFFDSQGFKLMDEMEEEIERLVEAGVEKLPYAVENQVGRVGQLDDPLQPYIDHLKNTINGDLSGLKIVLDCANGAAFEAAPRLFKELGAEVIPIFAEPDGVNINDNCGSTHPEELKKQVLAHGADLGIAHDGDADRMIAVDEKGRVVNGDAVMAICGLDMMKKGKLNHNTVVVTVYSNLGLKELLEEHGGTISQTKNGDRYVLERMLDKGYNLGGEQSGHIIFLDYATTGDGLLSAVQLLSVLKESGKKLSELADQLKPWPQLIDKVKVKRKEEFKTNEVIQAVIKDTEERLKAGGGRLLVRPSGTEPVIRIMLEGKDLAQLEAELEPIKEVIDRELN
ncbi:phosphoglucosamine mutase [Anoxybacter fermentans]|uniref:Phosphoglucosamine mutase n=1 Tax=Anoxybacter fermentans TaxID=1323375 RepID=A0A3Q9HNI2_9FIRM|nr:phosphoglucosamine mutase [Anoxybacter fermentans]AZR71949.1 phosphoglucosamine mutase [Anoxybacter fermentans]